MGRPLIIQEGIAVFDPTRRTGRCEKQSTRLRKFQALKELAAGGDPEMLQAKGGSFLFLACRRNDVEMIKRCIEGGVDIDLRGAGGYTPLMQAIASRNGPAASLLIDMKADFDIASDHGETPLMEAIHAGLRGIAVHLINAGADLNRRGEWSPTALDRAIERRDRELVMMLLDKGADMCLVGGHSAFTLEHDVYWLTSRSTGSPRYRFMPVANVFAPERKTAARLRAEMDSGAGFGGVAKAHSLHENHWMVREDDHVRALASLFSLPAGGISGPLRIRGINGYFIFRAGRVIAF